MLARHVHLPVQSGSDRMLKRMLRRYSVAEYRERVAELRREVADLTLSTDVIVGFPGETREDFEGTLELVREIGFSGLFGFKYSPRPYTPALRLDGEPSEEEKSARLEELFTLADGQREAHLETLVGSTARVICEGLGKTGGFSGRSERNEIVHFEAPFDPIGEIVPVRITRAFRNSLAGEPAPAFLDANPAPRVRAPEPRRTLPVLASSGLVRAYRGVSPRLASGVYVAPTAVVIGDVEIAEDSSVWYGAVIRADVGSIRIGRRSNVQDLSCIHVSKDRSNTVIGDDVTVGHHVVIHGARIHDGALIGIGAILLDNAEIGAEALVAAGSLVPAEMVGPPRVLVRGQPAKIVRDLTEAEWTQGRMLAERYVGVARDHACEP